MDRREKAASAIWPERASTTVPGRAARAAYGLSGDPARLIYYKNLLHRRMYRNLISNEFLDIELYPVGVSNEPGLKRLYGSGRSTPHLQRAGPELRILATQWRLSPRWTFLRTRFDALQVTIKIDVEGLEFDVVKGATRTLTLTPKPFWLIEIVLTEQVPGGINTRMYDTFEIFWRNGYQARTADRERKLVQPKDIERWLAPGSRDFGSYNYLLEAA